MLAFITSLRHPENAFDYGRVELLLKDSLDSIAAQQNDDYVVIIVGNQAPSFMLKDRMFFVGVNFPAPPALQGPHAQRGPFVLDKGSKIAIGLVFSRQFDPDYVMIFDADDFVHRDLTGFVARSAGPDIAGWVLSEGFIYSRARGVYRRQRQFNRTCGTCHVVASWVYRTPPDLAITSSQAEVVEAFGETLPNILGAHRDAVQWLAKRDVHLRVLPFRGAVYQVDTSENHSRKGLVGPAKPLTRRLQVAYAIPAEGTLVERVLHGLGPVALIAGVVRGAAFLAQSFRRVVKTLAHTKADDKVSSG